MPGELIETKIHTPPLNASAVRRQRLLKKLKSAKRHKLTMVWAPAGYGKTTLLAMMAGETANGPAWLSLDDHDNDPNIFWTYFTAALNRACPEIGCTALQMLQSASGFPLKSIVKNLINDICQYKKPLCLILDDFHLIAAPGIHKIFKFFLEHLPRHMYLVVSSRTGLSAIAGWEAATGPVLEIGMDELKFTVRETQLFARLIMGRKLDDDAAVELVSHCEGWAAGLQIAALGAMNSQWPHLSSMPELQGHITEYFMDEVFSNQPGHIQSFLLDTAILDRLSGPLCDAVTNRDDSASILEHLCSARMFVVALDKASHWFRYHHMFAECLKSQLNKTRPDRAALLHIRAAKWFHEQDMPAEAIDHATSGRDWDLASQLVSQHAATAILGGCAKKALQWIQSLPGSRIMKNPSLCISYAWALYLTNLGKFHTTPFHAIEQLLNEAEAYYRESVPASKKDSEKWRLLRAHMDVLRVNLSYARNEPPERVIFLGRQILHKFKEDNIFIYANIYSTMAMAYLCMGDLHSCSQYLEATRGAAMKGGFYYLLILSDFVRTVLAKARGELHRAEVICESSYASVEQAFVKNGKLATDMLGYYDLNRAAVLYETNHLQKAAEVLESAMESVHLLPDPFILQMGYKLMFLIRLFSDADKASVFEPLTELEKLGGYNNRGRSLAPALQIRYIIHRCGEADQELNTAFALAEHHNLRLEDSRSRLALTHPAPFEKVGVFIEQLTLVRLHLAAARRSGTDFSGALTVTTLISRLDRLIEKISWEDYYEKRIEALMLLALAHDLNSNPAGAKAALKEALQCAEPEGNARMFINEGLPMAALLEKTGNKRTELGKRIIRAINVENRTTGPDLFEDPANEAVQRLSRQERLVMGLLARGLTNKEIADELGVSAETVKKHNYNIFRKLKVNRRMAAVEKVRQLKIC